VRFLAKLAVLAYDKRGAGRVLRRGPRRTSREGESDVIGISRYAPGQLRTGSRNALSKVRLELSGSRVSFGRSAGAEE